MTDYGEAPAICRSQTSGRIFATGPWFAPIALPIWALQQRLYLLALIMFVVSGAINYYADQKAQIVPFVVQFALFGLLANRVRRRLAAVHDRVRRLALIVEESDVDDVVVEGAIEVYPEVVEEPQIRV